MEQGKNRLKEIRRAIQLPIVGVSMNARVSPALLSAVEKWAYPTTDAVCQKNADALGVEKTDIWPDA